MSELLIDKHNIPKTTKARYIICPELSCKGFEAEVCWCTLTQRAIDNNFIPSDKGEVKICPHLDKALMVVFCHYNHVMEEIVNCDTWTRSDCKNCTSMSFAKMSTTTYKIPIDEYEEFKNRLLINKD